MMKIAIVVPGRHFVFELGSALLARGHDITVFTNYPAWMSREFGFPPERVRSFLALGAVERVVLRLLSEPRQKEVWPVFQKALGKWTAKQMARERWDVVHEFSGVGEEVIRAIRGPKHLLMRASSHIRTQAELLREEADRTGVASALQPSPWIIEREEREYASADYVVVPSRFSYDSFVRQGVPAEKLLLLPLGVDTQAFRISEEMLERRCQRILSGAPLTVLTAAQVNFQKGLYDFAKIAAACNGRIRFRWIGVIFEEARETITRLPACVEMMSHQPQAALPRVYAEADLFLLPTIQDGYALVLAQAQANSLPLLTTTNCSGPDIIQEGQTGWVLPIRSPEKFIEQLLWCDAHREELAHMVRAMTGRFRARDWTDVAADFESLCATATGA
jgi:glycosyltransferase involved in cell wall biosynthesis